MSEDTPSFKINMELKGSTWEYSYAVGGEQHSATRKVSWETFQKFVSLIDYFRNMDRYDRELWAKEHEAKLWIVTNLDRAKQEIERTEERMRKASDEQ